MEGCKTNVAVICEEFTTTRFLIAAPIPASRIVVSGAKFVPERVTLTEVPACPMFGAIDARVGARDVAVTRKGTDVEVPLGVATVTLYVPGVAFAASVKTALTAVALATETEVAITPVPLTVTVAPETKLVPVRFTSKFVPAVPEAGAIEVNVGLGLAALIVNVAALLVPAVVETERLRAPVAAFAAIVKVAEICPAFTTVTFDAVTPVPPTATARFPNRNYFPLSSR